MAWRMQALLFVKFCCHVLSYLWSFSASKSLTPLKYSGVLCEEPHIYAGTTFSMDKLH